MFEGKVALVTGGGNGIGQATVWALAAKGAKVIAADIDKKGLAATQEKAAAPITILKCDVTSDSDVRAMVAVAAGMGGLDAAVNCAAISQDPMPIEKCPNDVYERVMRVNAFGVWLCMRHELIHMLERGRGSIVNVVSAAGLRGSPMMSAYAASKHAVIGMTRSVGKEAAASGVRVNALCPGPTNTPMFQESLAQNPQYTATVAKGVPAGRLAEPGEISDAILYLASDASSFIFGATLAADGGVTA